MQWIYEDPSTAPSANSAYMKEAFTFSMNIAVSIPDDVFAEAESLAQRLNTSSSELYGRSLTE
jgi:hypothetical protein